MRRNSQLCMSIGRLYTEVDNLPYNSQSLSGVHFLSTSISVPHRYHSVYAWSAEHCVSAARIWPAITVHHQTITNKQIDQIKNNSQRRRKYICNVVMCCIVVGDTNLIAQCKSCICNLQQLIQFFFAIVWNARDIAQCASKFRIRNVYRSTDVFCHGFRAF